jgi:heptosyltransferase-2
VSAVSMAMHITIALKKKLVLFNNIFNKNEFYLYDRGVILEPDFDCPCYFTSVCPNNCMQYLYPEKVLDSIITLLKD